MDAGLIKTLTEAGTAVAIALPMLVLFMRYIGRRDDLMREIAKEGRDVVKANTEALARNDEVIRATLELNRQAMGALTRAQEINGKLWAEMLARKGEEHGRVRT